MQTSDGKTEKLVNNAHPAGVAESEIIVYRDQLTVFTGKSIEIKRHGSDKSLTFSGRHFSNCSAVQSNTAHDLYIKRYHFPGLLLAADLKTFADHAAADIFHNCECLAHNVVKSFAGGEPVFELRSFRLKFGIRKFLILLLQSVYPAYQWHHFFDVTL